jgi:sterol desaturase/sphingolipid hydroxylase (fatty acid hydroxylase superfamily)
MNYERLRVTFVGIVATLVDSIVVAEFAGYWLHRLLHLENFWRSRVPLRRSWFLRARRLHDIHHRSVNSNGFMDTNFGIGFYFFDRFFRTMAKRHSPFSRTGYRAAIQRSGLDETVLLSLRGCSKALFHKSDLRLRG